MGNWIQILIILIAVGGPVLGRIFQEVEKKRKVRQRQKEIEARQLEALRTGRVSTRAQTTPASPTARDASTPQAGPVPTTTVSTTPSRSSSQRMQEIARKRQQQLEELRRRQQAAREKAAGRSSSGQSPTRPKRPPANRQRPDPQMVRSRPLSQTPPKQPPPRESSIHELAINQQVLQPAAETTPPAAAVPVSLLGKQMSAEDWRRFIVARELLEPPLALRQHHGGSPL